LAYIERRKTSDGKVSYRVQVRKKGYPLQTATFERKTDANKWAKSIESAIEERRYRNVAQAKRRTVAELIDRYKDDYLSHKAKGGSDQKYQLNWWRDEIGMLTLADLTPDLIAECRNKLAKTKTRRKTLISPGSVNR